MGINKGEKTTPSNSKHGEPRPVDPGKAHHKNVMPDELVEKLEKDRHNTQEMEETVAENMVYTVASDLVPDVKKGLQGKTAQVGRGTVDLASKVQPKQVTVDQMREQAEQVEEHLGKGKKKDERRKDKK